MIFSADGANMLGRLLPLLTSTADKHQNQRYLISADHVLMRPVINRAAHIMSEQHCIWLASPGPNFPERRSFSDTVTDHVMKCLVESKSLSNSIWKCVLSNSIWKCVRLSRPTFQIFLICCESSFPSRPTSCSTRQTLGLVWICCYETPTPALSSLQASIRRSIVFVYCRVCRC